MNYFSILLILFFASYVDDNTPYTTDESAEKVIDKLEKEAKNLFKWFSDNQTKVNPEVLQVKVN